MIILAFKEVSNANNFINLESSDLEIRLTVPAVQGLALKVFKCLRKFVLKVSFQLKLAQAVWAIRRATAVLLDSDWRIPYGLSEPLGAIGDQKMIRNF